MSRKLARSAPIAFPAAARRLTGRSRSGGRWVHMGPFGAIRRPMRPLLHPFLVNGRTGDPALYVETLFERGALLFDLGDITNLVAAPNPASRARVRLAYAYRPLHRIRPSSQNPGRAGQGRPVVRAAGLHRAGASQACRLLLESRRSLRRGLDLRRHRGRRRSDVLDGAAEAQDRVFGRAAERRRAGRRPLVRGAQFLRRHRRPRSPHAMPRLRRPGDGARKRLEEQARRARASGRPVAPSFSSARFSTGGPTTIRSASARLEG